MTVLHDDMKAEEFLKIGFRRHEFQSSHDFSRSAPSIMTQQPYLSDLGRFEVDQKRLAPLTVNVTIKPPSSARGNPCDMDYENNAGSSHWSLPYLYSPAPTRWHIFETGLIRSR
jgi:hypothetical protein